jgi:hypothetical protein
VKVVINRCYGGFGLSHAAIIELIRLGSPSVESLTPPEYYGEKHYETDHATDLAEGSDLGSGYIGHRMHIGVVFKDGRVHSAKYDRSVRTDPHVVDVVERMGDAANGRHARLDIVEIPDGVEWVIDEYDGVESIEEAHRSWS